MQMPGLLGSFVAHCASVVHRSQECVVKLQIGADGLLQSSSFTHSTQAPASSSHTAAAPSGPASAHCAGSVHRNGTSASLASRASPPSPASLASGCSVAASSETQTNLPPSPLS